MSIMLSDVCDLSSSRSVISGILPFGAVFVELFFILSVCPYMATFFDVIDPKGQS